MTDDELEMEDMSNDDFSASEEDEWLPGKESKKKKVNVSTDEETSDDTLEDYGNSIKRKTRRVGNLRKSNFLNTKKSATITSASQVVQSEVSPNLLNILESSKYQKKKMILDKDDDESSDSSVDEHLIKPGNLDLTSKFFEPMAKSANLVQFDCSAGLKLTDSSENEEFEGFKDSQATTSKDDTKRLIKELNQSSSNHFDQLDTFNKTLEEAKQKLIDYKSSRNESSLDIHSLLAMGEKKLKKSRKSKKEAKIQIDSDHSDDNDCWEEVEQKEKGHNNSQDIEITISNGIAEKKKKTNCVDLAIRREINRVKKENQVYLHKSSIICLVAHGNYLNEITNDSKLMELALKLLPSQTCCPKDRTDFKYFSLISRHFRKLLFLESSNFHPEKVGNGSRLAESLKQQLTEKKAVCKRDFILAFIILLRAIGIHCRLVMSLPVPPKKLPQSELLCTTATNTAVKKDDKTKKRKSDLPNVPQLDGGNDDVPSGSKKPKLSSSFGGQSSRDKEFKDKSANNNEKLRKVVSFSNNRTKNEATTSSQASNKSFNAFSAAGQTKSNKGDSSKFEEVKTKSNVNASIVAQKSSVDQLSISRGISIRASMAISKSLGNKSNPLNSSIQSSTVVPRKLPVAPNLKPIFDKSNPSHSSIKSSTVVPRKLPVAPNFKSIVDKSNVARLKLKADGCRNVFSTNEMINISNHNAFQNHSANFMLPRNKLTIPELNKMKMTDNSRPFSSPISNLTVGKRNSTQGNSSNTKKIKSNEEIGQKLKVVHDAASNSVLFDLTEKRILHPHERTSSTSKLNVKSIIQKSEEARSKLNDKSKKKIDDKSKASNSIQYDLTAVPEDEKSLLERAVKKTKDAKKLLSKSLTANLLTTEKFKPDPKLSKSFEAIPTKNSKFFTNWDNRILSTDDDDEADTPDVTPKRTSKLGLYLWVEVFSEEEEKWITIDILSNSVNFLDHIVKKVNSPITYVFAWNNDGSIKDVSARYCPKFNTVTKKLRVEEDWLDRLLNHFKGKRTGKDILEDKYLTKIQLEQPLPIAISEYKNHPLFALKRHLLKFEGIYPPDAPTMGFIKGEAVYARECVQVLHSREMWLKSAKVVKLNETPYKVVNARPKYNKSTGKTDPAQALELFGHWQTEDYVPPTAENGLVPRNAYGSVELFKPCMLPKGTVHLKLPGLNKVCRKLGIDCAQAITGFDFHAGGSHPVYDGFVVCTEIKDTVEAAWKEEQKEIEAKEKDKFEKRVYGNWKKLIKGLLIKRKLQNKYNFNNL